MDFLFYVVDVAVEGGVGGGLVGAVQASPCEVVGATIVEAVVAVLHGKGEDVFD